MQPDRQTNGVQLQNADSSAGKGDCREGEALQKRTGAGLVWSQLSEQRGSPLVGPGTSDRRHKWIACPDRCN